MRGITRDVAIAGGHYSPPPSKAKGLIMSDEVVVPVVAPISVEEGVTTVPGSPERASGNPKDIGVLT